MVACDWGLALACDVRAPCSPYDGKMISQKEPDE